MDFVPCRYDIRERVIKIDSFEGVSPRYVIHQAIRQKQVYITRAKNPIETKGNSSIFLSISPPSFFSLFGFGIPKPTHSKN